MDRINLQNKAKATAGTAEMYWFENEFVGLKNTLFHRISIPLTPFDSGFEDESQPVQTTIWFDWLVLPLNNPADLGDLTISSQDFERLETSVYIGGRHNWCEVEMLKINKIKDLHFAVEGTLLIDFQAEGVAENEIFTFQTTIDFVNTIIYRQAKITPIKIGQFVTLWKRNETGITAPFDLNDALDFAIIWVKTTENNGKFIFPKAILHEKGILSNDQKGGKRGFRVYPPWDKAENRQAQATQKWQLDYFLEG
jgi:hypothetical protein